MEPDNPLAGFPERFRGSRQNVPVNIGHLEKVFPANGIRLILSHGNGGVDMPLNPALHGLDGPHVEVVEMLLFGFGIDAPVALNLIQETAPAQFQAHLEIRGKVGVVPDAADDVVALDVILQEVVGIVRIPFARAHLGHKVHPSAAKSVVRVYINRMHGHQGAEILCPGIIPVEGAVRVVGNDLPQAFGRNNASVVVLVQKALGPDLFLCLGQFLLTEGK